jgi:UDP-glucuronate 4-epimerase
MNILITGCAGFIGARVTEFMLDRGHTVVGVDNLNNAYDVRLKRWRLGRLEGRPGFTFHLHDICNREHLRAVFKASVPSAALAGRVSTGRRWAPIDSVVNLAARAGVRQSIETPWAYFETNVRGTLNLLELCREFGISKLVLASTSSLYGAHNPLPFNEQANTDAPLSPYAASKKAAETLCYAYHSLYGIGITVLRYFTVYGPGGRPDMSIFRFIQWISEGRPVVVYGDGRQSRDFTYVDDIAHGTLAALSPLKYEIINLGSDRPVVLLDAIRLIEDILGRKAVLDFRPSHPADVAATWADIGKARAMLEWEPKTLFREGIERSIRWYRENCAWASSVPTF